MPLQAEPELKRSNELVSLIRPWPYFVGGYMETVMLMLMLILRIICIPGPLLIYG
jgi:hypothetical protein